MISSLHPNKPKLRHPSFNNKNIHPIHKMEHNPINTQQTMHAIKSTNGQSHISSNGSSLIPLNHKRLSKIKRYNKKLKSIASGKSKELHHVMKQYKIKRNSALNYYQNDLKNTLFLLRENAQNKQSLILAENKQQNKLLNKRIINKLQKIKEKLVRNNSAYLSTDSLQHEIHQVLNDSVENVNYSSSRRMTRNRAKSIANGSQRSKKNIDLTKYKFGLNPTQIGKDLRYLMAKETQKDREKVDKQNVMTTNDEYAVSHGFNYDNYYRNNNISLGLISQPVGFLNDRHLFESQLTGIYYKKTRSKRTRSTRTNYSYATNECHVYANSHSPQKCRFEAADDDKDYVMNENDDEVSDENCEIEQENTVTIDDYRFKANHKIKIIENDHSVSYGEIHRVMKYHIKVKVENKLRQIKYKEINNGYVNVFPL